MEKESPMASEGNVVLKWDKDFQLTVTGGNHTVVINRPASEEEHGVGPIHLFMAGLGGCIMSVTGMFLDRRNIPIDNLKVEMNWEYAQDPFRIGKVKVKLILPVKIDKKISTALDKVAHSCTVHNTLTHPPEIKIEIETPQSKT